MDWGLNVEKTNGDIYREYFVKTMEHNSYNFEKFQVNFNSFDDEYVF